MLAIRPSLKKTVSFSLPFESTMASPQNSVGSVRVGDRDLYGSSEEHARLKKWLNNNHLPQSLTLTLKPLGVRNVEDMAMLMEEVPEQFEELEIPKLDRIKLKRAVNNFREEKEWMELH